MDGGERMTGSAAPEPPGEERTPNGGRSLLELLPKGLYYEFIAVPCGSRYTMPLGVYNGVKPTFTVYRDSGLYRVLRGGVRELFLLAPYDPLLFYESLTHRLEHVIVWGGDGCPVVSESLGCWFHCTPRLVAEDQGFDTYECSSFKHIAGSPPPYSRVMGCLVELLVVYTKAKAGVLSGGYVGYARWLRWCIERASRGDPRYVSIAELVLQDIERASREIR
jgi:hypothetical protein